MGKVSRRTKKDRASGKRPPRMGGWGPREMKRDKIGDEAWATARREIPEDKNQGRGAGKARKVLVSDAIWEAAATVM